jgi:predicted TIM-barrel fold metal-dependent hydrolase
MMGRGYAFQVAPGNIRLFQWCELNGVPILTHATDSQSAGKNFAERAHPKYWGLVLKNFPALRINFGHFGDFEEICNAQPTWESVVGELMQEAPGRAFADLSYFSEILPGAEVPACRSNVLTYLASFLQTYKEAENSLLYGSDWIMLGIEAGYQCYSGILLNALERIRLAHQQQEKIFFGNAMRYLGWNKMGAASRLRRYYQVHNLPLGWLEGATFS